MTSAVGEGGGGNQKADKRNKVAMNPVCGNWQGGGGKCKGNLKCFSDVIYVETLILALAQFHMSDTHILGYSDTLGLGKSVTGSRYLLTVTHFVTGLPAYSDTIGTRESVIVSGVSL